MFNFNFADMIAGVPGIIIAMSVHEYAHARMAQAMGDDTARLMGRTTMNPLAHIDPIGLIMLFLVQFGWARPVPVNPARFRNWKQGEILVSLAGPASNLAAAFLAMAGLYILSDTGFMMSPGLQRVMSLIVLYNINFAVFNLIPIPPLDGSRILEVLAPRSWGDMMGRMEPYGFLILILLINTPFFGYILIPAQQGILMLYDGILSFL